MATITTAQLTRRQLLLALAILAAGLVAAWLLLTGKPKPESEPSADAHRPLVSVVVAEPRVTQLTVHTQGTVEPRRRVSLVAQVGGIVESVSADFLNGAFFDAGEVLLQIERDDYEFALVRARAQLAAAEQTLAEERGRYRQARREWRDLGSDDANDLFLRKPQLHAAEQALEAARADVEAAQLALERTRVSAPFAGRIETKRTDIGQYVAPGTVLAEVYAADVMEVRLPLADSQLGLLGVPLYAEGAPTPVTLSARIGDRVWQWQGQIRRTEASVDRSNRVVYAIVDVDDPFVASEPGQPPLLPGLFVSADISSPGIPGLTEIPASALRADNSVLLVSERGQLIRRQVSVRQREDDRAWVAGLKAGERVVSEQAATLVSGMLVEVSSPALAGK